MELENIILSEVTQSQKNIYGMHSLISGYKPKTRNTQDILHRLHEAQEEGVEQRLKERASRDCPT